MTSPNPNAATEFGNAVGLTEAPVFVETTNVIDLIMDDHAQAKDIYNRILVTPDLKTKARLRNELVKSLVQHDECEQLLVYPLLLEKFRTPEGKRHFDRSLAEHQELCEIMYCVRYLDIEESPDMFRFKLMNAMYAVFQHVSQEENEVLPLLKQNCTDAELQKVGASFKAHKCSAATRPHPWAPTQGFPAAVVNFFVKPTDVFRDLCEELFYQ